MLRLSSIYWGHLLAQYFCFIICAAHADQSELIDIIVKEHLSHLSNLNKVNAPLIITFSATAGMGKTFLAKKLEEELSGIRLTLDDGRILMKQHNIYPISGTEQDKINCIMNYLDLLLLSIKNSSHNQLIILDETVDRMYSKIAAITSKHNYPIFLIQIKASKETAIRRIKAREKSPEGYLNNIDRWYRDYLALDPQYITCSIDNDVDGQEPAIKELCNFLNSFSR